MRKTNASREYQLEDELNNLYCMIQQMVLASHDRNYAEMAQWQEELRLGMRHWMENMNEYMQAPEWQEVSEEPFVAMWSFKDGRPLALIK